MRLRRSLLCLAALIFAAEGARAQTIIEAGLGVHRSGLSGVPAGVDYVPREGMTVGLSMRIPVANGFGVRIGGRHRPAGGNARTFAAEALDSDPDPSVDTELGYLDLDALIELSLIGGANGSVYAQAGASYGVRRTCAISATLGDDRVPGDCDAAGVPTTDVGMLFGLGGRLLVMNGTSLGLGALYRAGLTDQDAGSDSSKSQGMSVLATIGFAIG
ncbi:hypothetical protein [Candidatus Palauibacter sp.]|uniref:hypothetical protein n=1 Tax=Candidatus Palauibacter sp. TaxID=3101350 RepID=UPI003B01D087